MRHKRVYQVSDLSGSWSRYSNLLKTSPNYTENRKKRSIQGQPLFADHTCIKSNIAYLQIVGLLIYFLNMYGLFHLKYCTDEL